MEGCFGPLGEGADEEQRGFSRSKRSTTICFSRDSVRSEGNSARAAVKHRPFLFSTASDRSMRRRYATVDAGERERKERTSE